MRAIALVIAVLAGLAVPVVCTAQVVSGEERAALVRLRTERGGQVEDVDSLLRLANEAAAKGLPTAPLTNKIREGFAKSKPTAQIEGVVRQIAGHLESADRIVRELDGEASAAQRGSAVVLLADALGSGLTGEEVRELRRVAQGGKPALTGIDLAGAAKGLSFIKEARLSVPEGTAVVSEAVRRAYPSREVVDVGREVRRRGDEYRSGRANLRSLRDAIARGDRPEQLFRSRPDESIRPAATRPEAAERPVRPEAPQRPEAPTRPERPATGRDAR